MNFDAKDQIDAFHLGKKYSPLYIGFILFLIEKCKPDNPSHIYFFTREGEFFKKIYDLLFYDEIFVTKEMPCSKVIEVSRMSTFCASIRNVSIPEMMRLWRQYSCQSMNGFFRSLNVDCLDFIEIINKFGLKSDEEINCIWKDERIVKLFSDGLFRLKLGKCISTQKSFLYNYLKNKDFFNEKNIHVVDIGWRGTIQDNLAIMFPEHFFKGYYLGLESYINEQTDNSEKCAFIFDKNKENDAEFWMDGVGLIEMLSNSENGSVENYDGKIHGTIVAVKKISQNENKVFQNFTSYFQYGVMHAVLELKRNCGPIKIKSDHLIEKSKSILRHIVRHSPETIARYYSVLLHNETFGVGRFIDRGEVLPLKFFILSPVSSIYRQKVIEYLRLNMWGRSYRERYKRIGNIHRAVIVVAISMAKIFRKLKYWVNSKRNGQQKLFHLNNCN